MRTTIEIDDDEPLAVTEPVMMEVLADSGSAPDRRATTPLRHHDGGRGEPNSHEPPEPSVGVGVQTVTMLDHLGLQCADLGAAAQFYDAVLAPLGGRRILDYGVAIGYGVGDHPDFWIGEQSTGDGFRESHVAFVADDRSAVEAFFATATSLGAEVLHEPRLWPEYHPGYYGAFVRDPDGNNVEAVCHSAA